MSDFLFKYNLREVFNGITDYLYNIRSYKDIRLQRFYVYPSARCNDQCIYCGECHKDGNAREIDFFENKDSIERLIRDVKFLKLKEVHLFGGGEPFFYKDNMLYFLEEMRSIDTFIKIITNGNNLSDEDIEKIVRGGLISNLAINLNTDSSQMAQNVYLDGERHSHTVSILESIAKYKKLYNKRYPLVDVFFVLFNMNYDKILSIISILEKFDISFFFIQPLRVYTQQHEKLKLSKEQMGAFEAMLPEIEKRLDEADIKSNTGDFKINKNLIEDSRNLKCVILNKVLQGRSKLACYLPLTTFFIYPEGIVHKCMYLQEVYNCSYFSFSSIQDMINSSEVTEFLAKFVEGTGVSHCQNCHACVLNEVEEIKKRFRDLKQAEPML